MIKSSSPLSKISRPSITGISPRERLFEFLDRGRELPVTWVSAPAGSGKTTLIASYLDSQRLSCIWYQVDEGDSDIATFFYFMGLAVKEAVPRNRRALPLLTPEYLQGVSTFARRFFEKLFSSLKPPFVLVFDNYQEVSSDSEFHEVIKEGLSVVPAGVRIIMISRIEPPAALVRLRANGKVYFAGWNDIRFNLDEFRQLSRAKGLPLKEEALRRLHGKTEGWVAGLVLLTEKLGGLDLDVQLPEKPGLTEIFDYFASELFQKAEKEIQDFLLKTAFLSTMTPEMAEKLTGNPRSDAILERLNRLHYFTDKNTLACPVYQYHALFREFLLSRASAVFSESEIARIQRASAGLLLEAGQIEHAALLLTDSRDWEGLVRLILGHAQALAGQGRGRTLEEWIAFLPKAIVENTPWLLYWTGICRMPFNLVESRGYLEQAFRSFKRENDPSGLYLSWSGIVNTFVFEWGDFTPFDHWISEMELLLREHPVFPSRAIEAQVTYGMFSALMYRQPQHPDFQGWEKRMTDIILSSTDIRLQTRMSSQLIFYYTWLTGDLAKAAFLVKTFKTESQSRDTDPLSFIVQRTFSAAYYWMIASQVECLAAVNEGLKAAEETGIHIWDPMLWVVGAMINTTSGNLKEGQMFLDKMWAVMNPTAYGMMHFYYYISTFAALCRNDLADAIGHARTCLAYGLKSGVPFASAVDSSALGNVLLEHNEREEGLASLADARRIGASVKSSIAVYRSYIGEALYYLKHNEIAPGFDALEKAMAIGRKQGFLNSSLWRPADMAFLCAKALEAGIEVEYVQELIRKRDLVPDASALDIESWPWPLKIRTLGRFEIIKEDLPVTFSGKVQQKPLALLKAIIAHGGKEVNRQEVTDDLWPDADGDQAYKSFEIGLHRLRKLLGNDKAVCLNQGLVTLDRRQCWVDVYAFESIVSEVEETFRGAPTEDRVKRAIRLIERILNLYRGHFLEREIEASWAIPLRERLRSKFVDCISRCGRYLEKGGHEENAIACLEKGLELDNTYEEFYQQLMAYYHKIGRAAAARDVYRRCTAVLSASLGVEPSDKTREMYSAITRTPPND